MDPIVAAIAAIGGYLLGSLSFARIVSRLVAPGVDITQLAVRHQDGAEIAETTFSGIGANTASMALGPGLGALIAVLDILKVLVPTLLLRLIYPDHPYYLMAAAAGLAGHNWPIYYGFRGGRGFSAMLGGLLVVDWLGVLVTILASLLLGFAVGNVSLGYVGWVILMIPWVWFRSHDVATLSYVLVATVLFFLATLPEIRTVLALRREGRLEPYLEGLTNSSPRWRGMQKIASWFRALGRSRS